MSDRRVTDHHREREIGRFLDEQLYPSIATTAERQSDRDVQLSGTDVVASIPGVGRAIHIDEKAQTDYLNDPRPTFVLELNSRDRSGDVYEGWFYDESKQTEYYLFVWVTDALLVTLVESETGERLRFEGRGSERLNEIADNLAWELMYGDDGETIDFESDTAEGFEQEIASIPERLKQRGGDVTEAALASENIRELRCLLVEQADIQRFLADEGYPQERVREDAAEIRRTGEAGSHEAGHQDFKYYLTIRKDEEPVNIVMYYRRLHTLATETYVVTPGAVHTGQRLF
jgi:hypothetical protein